MRAENCLGPEIAYVRGDLHVEGVDLKTLANDPMVSTPTYVYSLALLKRRYEEFKAAVHSIDTDARVCFAVKSLSNQAILKAFAGWEAGADLVTRGELERALRAGFDPSRIVFSGLGKTDDDLRRAIEVGVQINVESISELDRALVVSRALGRRARVAIRLNPQLDAMRGDLGQITTGKPDSKFGIPWTTVKELLPGFATRYPSIDLLGASVHIGSSLKVEGDEAASFAETFRFLAHSVVSAFLAAGVSPVVIDLGGGVGIDYDATVGEKASTPSLPNPWLKRYVDLIRDSFAELIASRKVRLIFEPGRILSGEAGVLLTKVLHVKDETNDRAGGERAVFGVRFLIVDAGMNDLMRPGLYGAYHPIVPVRFAEPDLDNVDICGAVCETTDSFMRPTREWLVRYNNLFKKGPNDVTAADADSRAANDGEKRTLYEQGSFGEVAPQFKDGDERRTYEYFVKRRFPSSVGRGDLVAILNAGAYGAVMSSEYNSRLLIPEVLVDRDRYAVIRPRPSYDDLIGRDREPDWRG